MAFIQKIFSSNKFGRPNTRSHHLSENGSDWKKPCFDKNSIRLVLFRDSKGRKIIFDSKALIRADEKCSKWGRKAQAHILNPLTEGQIQKNCRHVKPINYQPPKTGSDSKMLEELMFGAVGVAYKGTSLKVHVMRSPPQLMLTKVFIPDRPKCLDGEECSVVSAPDDLTLAQRIQSQDSIDSHGVGQSVPMDVPSPKHNWVQSNDLLDEDSGLASLTSSGSFQAAFPSPGSNSSSNSVMKRIYRGQWTSLEGCGRKRSHQDILSSEFTSPGQSKKCKMALGIIFGTIDENNPEANRLFETFFFSHIALFESHLEQLRLDVEKAYFNPNPMFYFSLMTEAFEVFKTKIFDLFTAPRLREPVWLNMMAYSSYRYMLCEKFLKEFVLLTTKFDNKSTNFFMSTLVTAVLTYHLAWVPTVIPAGGMPSATYLDKHTAKWVDTLAKSHPYNPLWAQLGDLYGAIGFPLKLSRTIVIGKKADVVKRFLYVLSYFIRCSDIVETSELGCLETCLKKTDFTVESPIDSDKTRVLITPSPMTECNSSVTSSSSLETNVKSSTNCKACEQNKSTQSLMENKVGKNVFYVNSDSCICDKVKHSVNGIVEIKVPQTRDNIKLEKEIPQEFRVKVSNTMFNENAGTKSTEIKTVDELDKSDLYLSSIQKRDGDCVAQSLIDVSYSKCAQIRTETESRVRLGSLDHQYKFRRSSLSRQISETSKSTRNIPVKYRPLTPTDLGKRKHISSSSSFDLDLSDPRSYCQELQMPNCGQDISSCNQKDFDRNFARSLLADYADHYLSDFVLHGTSDKHLEDKISRDIKMTMQYSVLDETVGEAVCVVADTDHWTVKIFSSQYIDRKICDQCVASQLVSNMVETVVSMAKLKMSPEFCMMHLEDRLQEIYFKSKMMAEYLKKNKNVPSLLSMFGLERSDLPLLVAIAGTHTPSFPLGFL